MSGFRYQVWGVPLSGDAVLLSAADSHTSAMELAFQANRDGGSRVEIRQAEEPTPKAASPESASVVDLTADSWQTKVVACVQPCLVAFSAEWCHYCRQLAPVLASLGVKYTGRALIGRVDADSERALLSRYGVHGLPTVILFKGGHAAQTFVGYRDEQTLSAALDKLL